MGFRFRKSIKAGPVRINLSKSGVGYSIGGKGFRYTKKANGGTRTTYSVPGTGLSYVNESSSKKKTTKSPPKQIPAAPASSHSNVSTREDRLAGYCKHCLRMIEDGTDICPACGRSQYEKAQAQGKKRTWRFYAGIFCVFGAIVMLTENIIGSLIYSVLAFLLLRKSKPETQSGSFETAPLDISNPHNHAASKTTAISGAKSHINSPRDLELEKSADAIVRAMHKQTVRDLYGNDAVNNDFSYENDLPEFMKSTPSGIEKTHKATGMEHYKDNIMELALPNPYYDWTKQELVDIHMTEERIYQYEFDPKTVELVPEPDNPYDPNAVKVIVGGFHVAYIKRGSCSHILKLLKEDSISNISCIMGGGPYKYISEEYDDEADRDIYVMEKGDTKFFVHLKITEKT